MKTQKHQWHSVLGTLPCGGNCEVQVAIKNDLENPCTAWWWDYEGFFGTGYKMLIEDVTHWRFKNKTT